MLISLLFLAGAIAFINACGRARDADSERRRCDPIVWLQMVLGAALMAGAVIARSI